MSDNPFSSFAERIAGKIFGSSTSKLSLTAFGKHPGWDDHIYDLRVDTEALVAVRQYIYTDGIGSIIDSGEWDKLSPGELIEEFDHAFFWLAGDDLVLGRMWSSSDGKGRTRYPMILCAHIAGSESTDLLRMVLGHLERIELACKAATTSDNVRLALDNGALELLEAVKTSPPPIPGATDYGSISSIQFEDSREELMRACYAIQSQLNVPGKKYPKSGNQISLKLDQLDFLAQHIRLPAGPSQPARTVAFWTNVLSKLASVEVPCLFLAPRDQGFIDLIVGKPGPAQLVCLRETEAKIPCVSAIPYELTEEFKTSITALLN